MGVDKPDIILHEVKYLLDFASTHKYLGLNILFFKLPEIINAVLV